jgi:glycerophosphoryl diester phosphodiesterase
MSRTLPRTIDVLGHRGDTQSAAENTLRACATALEKGATGVEVDVCLTGDGRVVLLHDRDPDDPIAIARQSVGEGLLYVPLVPDLGSELRRPVSELTFDDLRAHYGYRRNTAALLDLVGVEDERKVEIATLEELCEWAAREPRVRTLAFDNKLDESEVALASRLLDGFAAACERYPAVRDRRLLLLCANLEMYIALRDALANRSELACFTLVPDFEQTGVVEVADELGARDVSIGLTPLRLWAEVRADLVSALDARSSGALHSVTLWGANEESALREAIELGVDALITDDVDGTRRLLREHRM